MNIKIIAVGKIKEQYLKDALKEYEKRLTPFCNFSVSEVNAEQIQNEALAQKYMETEAEKIIQNIKPDSYVITLEINGKKLSSIDFAAKLKALANEGKSEIVFIIGGANGLSPKVSAMADFRLSISDMTFTHQMVRVILAEQVYRAFKINANESYHR